MDHCLNGVWTQQIHTVCRSSKSQPSILDLTVPIHNTDFNNFTQCQILNVHFKSDGAKQLHDAIGCNIYSGKSPSGVRRAYHEGTNVLVSQCCQKSHWIDEIKPKQEFISVETIINLKLNFVRIKLGLI